MKRKTIAALLAVLVALVGPAAAPATATNEADIVGEWDTMIIIYIQEPPLWAHLTCTFYADQKLACVNMPDTEPLQGRGVWNKAQGNNFGFWITHAAHKDEHGNPVGSIYGMHLGKFTKNHWETKAFTYIDFHNDTPWIGPVRVTGEGTRIR